MNLMAGRAGNIGSLVLLILFIFSLILIADESWGQSEIQETFSGEAQVQDKKDDLNEARAEAENQQHPKNDGKIDIIYPAEFQAPYTERRSSWSTVFGINVDQVFPNNYRSKVSDDSYETLYGENPIPLVQLQIGAKYNFGLGSLMASVLIGKGEISDDSVGTPRDLGLLKKGLSGSFILDTLFAEPYVAPYIEGQIFSFDWSEGEDALLSKPAKDGSTGFTSAFVAGLLIQLNWLDPDASVRLQSSLGLNNTYLDLFISQYNSTDAKDDPNLETGTNFGAGLKLEF